MIGMDYSRKEIKIMEPFNPGGNINDDIPFIQQQFRKFQGIKHL